MDIGKLFPIPGKYPETTREKLQRMVLVRIKILMMVRRKVSRKVGEKDGEKVGDKVGEKVVRKY